MDGTKEGDIDTPPERRRVELSPAGEICMFAIGLTENQFSTHAGTREDASGSVLGPSMAGPNWILFRNNERQAAHEPYHQGVGAQK